MVGLDWLTQDDFLIRTGEGFGADGEDHRERIRLAIFQTLQSDYSIEAPEVMNLDLLPKVTGLSISIAHAPGLGGFVISKDASSIGFDIEKTDRVTEKKLGRVLSENESIDSVTPVSIMWCAKEAGVKWASWLGHSSLMSQVETSNWVNDGNDRWSCELILTHVDGSQVGKCRTLKHSDHTMSIAYS